MRLRLVAEDLDVGAQGIQPVGKILIAAVDHIDIPQLGLATGGEHAEQDADRGPQRGRTDHLLAAPAGRSFHNDAMRIQQLHPGTQPVQLSEVDRAVLIHPVMDDRFTLRCRRDHGEERQVVDVQPWERHRMNLVDRGAQQRRPDSQIDESGMSVDGQVLRCEVVVQSHFF